MYDKAINIFSILILFSSVASSQNWLPVGQITEYSVNVLYSDTATGSLIAGGNFKHADGIEVNGIARWNGTAWDSLASGVSNCSNYCFAPTQIVRHDSNLFVAGSFTEIGHISTHFATWDGSSWDTTGNFLVTWDSAGAQNVNPMTLTIVNNDLWVCGGFYNAGGMLVDNSVGIWNGTSYATFSAAALPPVYNGPPLIGYPTYFNGMWYFIGVFMDTAGQNCNVIRWTGSQWEIFGGGIKGGLSTVSSIAVYDNLLYIAGTFTQADGNPSNAIVSWDGTNWGDVGGGITDSAGYYGQIFDMTVFNNELWVVGNFQMAGGVVASNIAKWNGTQWCSLGDYFDNSIMTIESFNNEIYIGGGFWTIGGDSIQKIAKWVGGNFVDTCGTVSINELSISSEQIIVTPNPAHTSIKFTFPNNSEPQEVVIYDIVGRVVWHSSSEESVITIPIEGFVNGMYWYSVHSNSSSYSGNFIVQH